MQCEGEIFDVSEILCPKHSHLAGKKRCEHEKGEQNNNSYSSSGLQKRTSPLSSGIFASLLESASKFDLINFKRLFLRTTDFKGRIVDRIAVEFTRFFCLKVAASLTENAVQPLPSTVVRLFWSSAVSFVLEYYRLCETLTIPLTHGRPHIINFSPLEVDDSPMDILRERYESTIAEYMARYGEVEAFTFPQ